MNTVTKLTAVLAIVPAALCAQVSGQAQAAGSATVKSRDVAANANAQARTDAQFRAPKGWTAEGSAKLEAMYADARAHDVPPEPIARRVAEGYAKGSAESTILTSAGKVKANLEASHEAMVAGGRTHPSDAECERGASLMERGVTKVQIEEMARRTPSDRSLVVAFDVLGRLAARGVPVTQALAQVQAKLDARASDAALISLAGKPNAGGTITGGVSGTGGTTGGTSAGTTATGAVTGTTKGLTAGTTGTVTGIIKKP